MGGCTIKQLFFILLATLTLFATANVEEWYSMRRIRIQSILMCSNYEVVCE